LRNNIFKINDIWDKNNNTVVDNQTIFNRLDDKRNWISEWAKIKKSIPENFVKFSKTIEKKSGFLLNLISELSNMFLSKMSFLDSVEHDPKKLFHACIAS
jgi:hypothetical protein